MSEPNERTEPDERIDPPEPSPTPPLNPPPPVDMPGAALAAAETPEPPVAASTVDAPADNPPADSAPADSPRSTDWREPPWFPPRDKDRSEPKANLAAIVVGLIILAVGVYFFLDRTLGVAMPPVRWSSLWPVILIVVGGLVLIRSIQRR